MSAIILKCILTQIQWCNRNSIHKPNKKIYRRKLFQNMENPAQMLFVKGGGLEAQLVGLRSPSNLTTWNICTPTISIPRYQHHRKVSFCLLSKENLPNFLVLVHIAGASDLPNMKYFVWTPCQWMWCPAFHIRFWDISPTRLNCSLCQKKKRKVGVLENPEDKLWRNH